MGMQKQQCAHWPLLANNMHSCLPQHEIEGSAPWVNMQQIRLQCTMANTGDFVIVLTACRQRVDSMCTDAVAAEEQRSDSDVYMECSHLMQTMSRCKDATQWSSHLSSERYIYEAHGSYVAQRAYKWHPCCLKSTSSRSNGNSPRSHDPGDHDTLLFGYHFLHPTI